jgi:hypothetical protein
LTGGVGKGWFVTGRREILVRSGLINVTVVLDKNVAGWKFLGYLFDSWRYGTEGNVGRMTMIGLAIWRGRRGVKREFEVIRSEGR